MKLIQCTATTKPSDFKILAQNPVTYELLGFSSTGTEYAGDFAGFHCRIGSSSELGYSEDREYFPPTNESVRIKFNNWQDGLRAKAYRDETDSLAAEAFYKGTDEAKAIHASAVESIKLRYPKV